MKYRSFTGSPGTMLIAWLLFIFSLFCPISALAQEASFQSYNYRALYIRHYNFRGEITEINTEGDRKDATFRIVPGLADAKYVSFESANHPGHYLVNRDGRLVLLKSNNTNTFDRAATFKQVDGLKRRSWASFESLDHHRHYIRHRDFHLYVERGSGDLFRQDATFRIVDPLYDSEKERLASPGRSGEDTARDSGGGSRTKTAETTPARDLSRIDERLDYLRESVGFWPPRFPPGEAPQVWKAFNDTLDGLKEIEKRDPNNVEIQWRLGECYVLGTGIDEEHHYWDESETHLKRALSLDPDSADAYAAMGRRELLSYRISLLRSRQRCFDCINNAYANYDHALELTGGQFPAGLMGMAYVHYHLNGYENALEKADRYLSRVPGDDAFREFRNEVATSLQFKSGYKLNAKECLILEPSALDKGRTYPVLVILPFTGGTAGELLKHYLGSVSKHPCFVVVPPGLGSSADHSWEGFVACIERYEKHIQDGLDRLETTYGTQIGKLYLAGFSLGGDLSWALPLRSPEKYAGAVIMATRCGYPAKAEAVEILQSNGFRAFFLSGREELAARLEGMKQAVSLFSEAGIEHRFEQVPGGHVRADSDTFSEALGFLFD